MTITPSSGALITADLTCEEIHTGFDALVKRVAELTAERDVARQMALQATKDLVQARQQHAAKQKEHAAELKLLDSLISSVRIDRDGKHNEIRHLNSHIRELALMNEDMQRRFDAAQQQASAPTPRRRLFSRKRNQPMGPHIYRSRPVEAIQWTGHDICDDVYAFLGQTSPIHHSHTTITVPGSEYDEVAWIGDWIVKRCDGRYEVYSDAEFRNDFEADGDA